MSLLNIIYAKYSINKYYTHRQMKNIILIRQSWKKGYTLNKKNQLSFIKHTYQNLIHYNNYNLKLKSHSVS